MNGLCPYHSHFDASCCWCKADNYLKTGQREYPVEFKPHFPVDSDVGFYVAAKPVIRDPRWSDVVDMFISWWKKRPKYFVETALGISSTEEKNACVNTGEKP